MPFYDVQQEESINMIIEQTNMKAIVLTLNLLENILKLKKEGFANTIKYLITIEEPPPQLKEITRAMQIQVLSLNEVSKLVEEGGEEHPPTPDT